MKVIVDCTTAVFMYPGSYTRIPPSTSSSVRPPASLSALSCLNAVAGIALLTMGTVIVLPVLLSVTVSVALGLLRSMGGDGCGVRGRADSPTFCEGSRVDPGAPEGRCSSQLSPCNGHDTVLQSIRSDRGEMRSATRREERLDDLARVSGLVEWLVWVHWTAYEVVIPTLGCPHRPVPRRSLEPSRIDHCSSLVLLPHRSPPRPHSMPPKARAQRSKKAAPARKDSEPVQEESTAVLTGPLQVLVCSSCSPSARPRS
jgi:hypothetical protein